MRSAAGDGNVSVTVLPFTLRVRRKLGPCPASPGRRQWQVGLPQRPLVVVIEIISFLSRPISHSVRLFANMLAGHITLKVFASFVTMLGAFGFVGWVGAILPLGLTVALTALELLVAFLQAYVFTILTCIYINDAIHPGH